MDAFLPLALSKNVSLSSCTLAVLDGDCCSLASRRACHESVIQVTFSRCVINSKQVVRYKLACGLMVTWAAFETY